MDQTDTGEPLGPEFTIEGLTTEGIVAGQNMFGSFDIVIWILFVIWCLDFSQFKDSITLGDTL
jgi:hypothetical protein